MSSKEMINGVLLPFREKLFLAPIIALAEVNPTYTYTPVKACPPFMLGIVSWRNYHLPLVSPDLLPVNSTELKQPKFAIVNALFAGANWPPYFALVFEQSPQRVKLKAKDLAWLDQAQQKIKWTRSTTESELTLLDVAEISARVEKGGLLLLALMTRS